MLTRPLHIKYKKVNLFKGTERELSKRVKFLVSFDKFFAFAVFAGFIYAGFALIYWDIFKSEFWDKFFISVIVFGICFLIWAIFQEDIFANIKRIKDFTYIVENVEITDEGEMFVDAYRADDEDKMFKYHFFFDTAFEFTYDFFILHQVNLNGKKDFYFCRKSGK